MPAANQLPLPAVRMRSTGSTQSVGGNSVSGRVDEDVRNRNSPDCSLESRQGIVMALIIGYCGGRKESCHEDNEYRDEPTLFRNCTSIFFSL